jgi:hypothetical protein
MSPRPLIFISAVSRELRSARQLVANTLTYLGYEPVWQDIFGTESGDLRSVLREKINGCKGVVQLVGQCFGAEPPQPDETFGRVSYTQYEALYARERGKKVWYLVIDESFPTDPHDTEPAELRALQNAYRSRVQNDAHFFHQLGTRDALEANVLKLRDDLVRLRRGVKQWAVGVAGLLILILLLVGWMVRTQSAMSVQIAKLREGIERYPAVELQVAQSEPAANPVAVEDKVYAELARQLGVDARRLREKLPQVADELKRSDKDSRVRASAAYVAKDYSAAQRLALAAATEAQKAVGEPAGTPDLSKPSGGGAGATYHRSDPRAADALKVAALSAAKSGQLGQALIHYREAAKFTDRKADPRGWQELQSAISAVSLDLENAKKLKYEDSVSDLKQ